VVTIREIQEQARELRAAQGWPDAPAEERALSLVAEVGELVREVLRLARRGEGEDPAEVRDRLGLEMYDVVWNVCDLADKLGIDLDRAFAEKAALNRSRRW
jgi:NTP pyrophosphatase (non-canonical NTP hydrolase)